MNIYDQIKTFIKNKKRVLIASHINPDGDGIGSTLALAAALEHMGKEVVMFNRDAVPNNLAFLPGADRLVKEIPATPFDAAILVDSATPDRAGTVFEKAMEGVPKVAIDHHRIDHSNVELVCIDETAASTGEVVLRILKRMRVTITPDIALCIYCTLAVDTGFFRYSNTTEAVLRVAADLVALGADPWTVAKNLEESYPAPRLYLLARSLASLYLSHDGRYAYMDVTQKMIAETGANIELSDEFAGIPRTIDSVLVSALFRELPSGKIKVSLRSKEDIDVSAIAKRFDGGGHSHAAGCSITGTLEEAKQKIEAIVHAILKESK
jgi:phosphoesterase RecJ-like protein